MITLDACSPDDLDDFLTLALDPRVTARVGDGTPWNRDTALGRFRRGMAACVRGDGIWLLAREAGAGVGGVLGVVVAEIDLETPSEAEIGVWIAPPRWGRGHARELVAAALPLLRTTFPDVTPVAYANIDHVASARMLRAAGFAEDGTRAGRHGGTVTRFVAAGNAPGR